MTLTVAQVPFTGPYSVSGYGKHKGKTALALKRFSSRMGFLPWEPDKWDEMFNLKLEEALDKWDAGKDGYGEGRWLKARQAKTKDGSYALDSVCRNLITTEYKAVDLKLPKVGAVYNGGPNVLSYDCTHATSNIPLYPAFDTAFLPGTGVIAPEDMEVVRRSSANPGRAFYTRGKSGLKYWFGHLDRDHNIGKVFQKGDLIGRVIPTNVGGGPHCHVGVNVEGLWGAGKQLVHKTNYTHGAPLIGDQLADFLTG